MNELNKYARLQFRNCDVGRGLKVCLWEQMTEVVICRTDNNEAIARRPLSGQWILSTSALGLPLETVSSAVKMADDWIESELAKLKEKERAEALKAAPPVPLDGYRLCPMKEAANVTRGLAKVWVDGEWYSVGDLISMDKMPMVEAVVESGNGIYCTKAPRKFVRCTCDDASRLFEVGSHLNWRDRGTIEWLWLHFSKTWPTCEYRVDRYTIPEGFNLQPVMPTVKLPDGFGWVANGSRIVAFKTDGLVMEVPSSKYHFDDFLRRQKLRQATLDAYDEIHDGET